MLYINVYIVSCILQHDWLLLSVITVIKNILYPILFFVPMLNYFELILVYALLRSDFELCDSLFAVFKYYYEDFDIAKKIDVVTDKIAEKMTNMTKKTN